MKTISKLFAFSLLITIFTASAPRKTTIFMIGDSTMANKDTVGGKQERGWGMMLHEFFTDDIRIDNHAVNGRSSLSFINEGRWDRVICQVEPGDFVIIQFGHNDEKDKPDRHTDPGTTFDANLERFVNETRDKGGIPILMNSVVRRNFPDESPDVLVDTHGLYKEAPKNVAQRLHVHFIDANRITHELEQKMGPEDSKKLHMWFEPGQHPSEPEGKKDNTHYNIFGARTVARLLADAICQEVPLLKPFRKNQPALNRKPTSFYDSPDTIVVAQDGTGEFTTVSEAIEVCRAFMDYHKVIFVKNGIYHEKVIIPQWLQNIEICGEDNHKTVISYDDHANIKTQDFPAGIGTFRTYTLLVRGNVITLKNITIRNDAPKLGQAVALHTEGDRIIVLNCRIIGNQDTIYTGMPYTRIFFSDCYICGTTDFIFGPSAAWFENCTIESLANSYITAASTPSDQTYGYVFNNCRLIAAPGVDRVYLGRPWRDYGYTLFMNCEMGRHIRPEGWHHWKLERQTTARYYEYNNRGDGADTSHRVSWSHRLSPKQARRITLSSVFSLSSSWLPSLP